MANRRVVINSTADLNDGNAFDRAGLGHALICPLWHRDMTAALAVFRDVAKSFDGNDARLLERIAKQAAAVLFNARAFDQARAESLTDPLTGLPNRRCLDRQVGGILSRAERSHGEVSVLLVDMDRFKRLNDLYGHAAGDAALRSVANVFENSMRAYDLCCRYAGDEFVIVMDDCPAEIARRKADDFAAIVASLSIEVAGHGHIPLSCTAGTATFPEDGPTFDALVAVADSRMFAAKAMTADSDAIA
jgi:diguanylate cyclase (GGDEF)-like protein